MVYRCQKQTHESSQPRQKLPCCKLCTKLYVKLSEPEKTSSGAACRCASMRRACQTTGSIIEQTHTGRPCAYLQSTGLRGFLQTRVLQVLALEAWCFRWRIAAGAGGLLAAQTLTGLSTRLKSEGALSSSLGLCGQGPAQTLGLRILSRAHQRSTQCSIRSARQSSDALAPSTRQQTQPGTP